jgi:hydroxymethylpyrimidine pyrophosphatase-like HAD family hydrolase
MTKMLIAVDIDGTLFDGVTVAHEAVAALDSARSAGHQVVVVTGRRWEGLDLLIPEVLVLADCVVCEEGGVIVDVASGQVTLLADPVDGDMVAALVDAGVAPLDVGHVVVGAPATFIDEMSDVRDRFGGARRLVRNKASLALAPDGCDKASGLRAAIAVLGADDRPILAIGDAANDLPMFAAATIAVGVANADDAVRAAGVPLTAASVGLGVAEALQRYLPPAPS